MRKKLIAVLIVACLCLVTFSGCGNDEEPIYEDDSIYEETESEYKVESEEEFSSEDDNVSESSQPETTVDINWIKSSSVVTQADGWKFEITYKISPWILLSNTEIVNSAWKQINLENELPTFNDWKLKSSGSNMYSRAVDGSFNDFLMPATDMYYCVGTIEVKNITSGWNITKESPATVHMQNQWVCEYENSVDWYMEKPIIRLFYSNSVRDYTSFGMHAAKMTKDTWGPVSFVMMAPEYFAPNYPEGQFLEDMKKSYFRCYSTTYTSSVIYDVKEIYLGIYGKDGKYIPPIK